jgi:tetratricopeptide (TPR) repeat protein
MTQDYYEILQVHPRADGAAITAAYQRLRELYDPARLDGAADELVELARQKRDLIERAYAVLSDAQRRTNYDQEQAALAPANSERPAPNDAGPGRIAESVRPASAILRQKADAPPLDYRPLPPAKRAERSRHFDAQPIVDAPPSRQVARPAWQRLSAPIALVGLFVLVAAISLLVTQGSPAPPSAATPTPSALDQFESLIPALKSTAEQSSGDAQPWIDYGNLLYNSVEIVRENAPDSPLYQQRLPRWLAATEAYSRALTLQPDNPDVRADMGASACFYGVGVNDQHYVTSGAAEVRKAALAAPDNARVLLSLGHCLVSVQPPQTQEAIANWRRVVQLTTPDSPLAAQAQGLIARYSK